MNTELVQWQKLDDNGICYPWFTHPFLEVLDTWDLKGKRILEWGGGRSTIWWATRAASVLCVEANSKWAFEIADELAKNGIRDKVVINYVDAHEGELNHLTRDSYINKVGDLTYDIVVVDGILRYECMIKGIELLKQSGGILIVDNWQQDGFVCPACAELVNGFEGHVYRQEDHTDHHGNPWQTGYWKIPAA